MLRSKLTAIIKEEVARYLKEINSLDRAIDRLQRGGHADRSDDALVKRKRANNDDESARKKALSSAKGWKYVGHKTKQDGRKVFNFKQPNGSTWHGTEEYIRRRAKFLLDLIPLNDLDPGDLDDSWTPEADASWDEYVDNLLDNVGPKGPKGA